MPRRRAGSAAGDRGCSTSTVPSQTVALCARARTGHDGRGAEVDDQGQGEEGQAGGHQGRDAERPTTRWHRLAMRAETELPPACRMWRLAVKTGEMMRMHHDGLAQGPAQAEHRPADDAALAEGEHHRADHPPPGGAEGVGALPLPQRRLRERLAHDRAQDGDDHEGDGDADDEGRGGVERARLRPGWTGCRCRSP